MAELIGNKYRKLRTVQLDEVARYLDCNPEKLRTALRHLAENPSAIQYEIDKAASIAPAQRGSAEAAAAKDAEAKKASRMEAATEVLYRTMKPAWDLYRAMKPSEAKWIN